MSENQFVALNTKLDAMYGATWERIARQEALIGALNGRLDHIYHALIQIQEMQALILRQTFRDDIRS